MTPEQVERTIEFILASQANSAIRMDRLEEDLKRLAENQLRAAEEHERFHLSLREQKERLDILLSVSHDLVRVSRIHNDRLGRLESGSECG